MEYENKIKVIMDDSNLKNEGIAIDKFLTNDFEKKIDKKIMEVFLLIGVSANLQGYKFLKESIKVVMQDPEYINGITKKLYPYIAKKFNTTAYKVERGIRHAIEVSFGKGKMININKFFGFEVLTKDDKPTNSEFVALLADKLNLDMK